MIAVLVWCGVGHGGLYCSMVGCVVARGVGYGGLYCSMVGCVVARVLVVVVWCGGVGLLS